MGIHFLLAADGISRVLVLLTAWPLWPECYSVGILNSARTSLRIFPGADWRRLWSFSQL